MRRNKFKIILCTLIIIGSCFGGYILNDYLNKPQINQEPEREIYTPRENNNITAQSIIKGISSENKIISTAVSLSCEIKISESFFDLNILSKSQVLKFYGTALYTIDLANLSGRDIFIGENFIKIYIDKPELYALNLDAEQTVADRVERGLLSFGAIKISPEDYKSIQVLALEKMAEQLKGDDIILISEEQAKKSAADLFGSIITIVGRGILDAPPHKKDMLVEIDFKNQRVSAP